MTQSSPADSAGRAARTVGRRVESNHRLVILSGEYSLLGGCSGRGRFTRRSPRTVGSPRPACGESLFVRAPRAGQIAVARLKPKPNVAPDLDFSLWGCEGSADA